MTNQNIKENIEKLQQEIDGIKTIDKSSKEKLEGLLKALRSELSEGNPTISDTNNLISMLEDSIVHLEAEHPKLTEVMSSLLNILSNMGI